MYNYVTKALRTVLLEFKESGELHEAYKEQIQSTLESYNHWIGMMMKSICYDASIKEKQETEKRFKALEGDISGIRGMVKQLLDKLG